jgi:protein SCO1/2
LDKFPLIERSGANFKFDRLAGHVWVADVFFTSCPHECKMLTAQLRGLQNDFSDLRLVSLTCDPVNDTPEKLRQYADENGALPGRWFFLTGKMYDIQGVCQELFAHAPKGIEHSRRVAVIDRKGNWHGMYDVFEQKDMSQMRALIARLLANDPGPHVPRVDAPKPPEPASTAAAS